MSKSLQNTDGEMITITKSFIVHTPPTSLRPITTRWHRKYTEISEWYYYWTITKWETKDPTLQKLLKDGVLQETEKSYKVMKPLVLSQQELCLDKNLELDADIFSKINECDILHKNMNNNAITIQIRKSVHFETGE